MAPPAWAPQLPSSQQLTADGPAALRRRQSQLRRRGRDAERWLLTLSERAIRDSCPGSLRLAVQYRPAIELDDLIQRGMQAVSRLLPVYASKDRPPCSWLGMLRLDGRRDVHRELTNLDWLPTDAVAALALANACGIDLTADPPKAWAEVVDAAGELGRAVPRIAPAQLEAALRAPALALHDATVAAVVASVDSADPDAGSIAATVARLVSADAALIAQAQEGDSEALRRVGEKVILTLSANRRTVRACRDRVWDHFQQSGELFTSPLGQERFSPVAGFDTLAAIDECLRRAARLQPVPSAR